MQEEQKKLMHNQETLLKEQSELQGELHLHKDTHFRDVLEHPDDVKSSKSTKYGQNKVTVGRGRGTILGSTAESKARGSPDGSGRGRLVWPGGLALP